MSLKAILIVTCFAAVASTAAAQSTGASLSGMGSSSSSDSSSSVKSDGSNTATVEGVLDVRKFEDTKILTDPNLRATDGNLYQYSFKASLSYSGPTLGDTSAQNQPNPDKSVGNFAQRITGNATLNYRLNAAQSISAGTGVIMNYPFAGDSYANSLMAKSGNSRYSVNNPFLMYNIASRFDELQMRNSFQVIDSTQQVYTHFGEVGGLNYYNSMVYGLGTSRFALSWETSAYYWIFGRPYNSAPTSQGGDKGYLVLQQYTLGATPGVKYNFTDSLNLYTSMGLGWQNPRNGTGNLTALLPRAPSMSVGLGYAYKRDIYIAPYIATYPFSANESANETTINVTTTFSIL